MTDATGTTTYHYDTAGRFVGMTYPHGGSVMYDRDVLSRVTDVRVKTSASATELVGMIRTGSTRQRYGHGGVAGVDRGPDRAVHTSARRS